MCGTKVWVADAGSTDRTVEVALNFRDRFQVSVIPGGLPAVGRNAGAKLAQTPYLLFLDADIELGSPSLVRRVVETAIQKDLHCVTTNVICSQGSVVDYLFYLTNNLFQHLSRIHRPFSTGMFMLFATRRFNELGGFNEQAGFAEDYLLSRLVDRRRFSIVRGGVCTSNRRLRKMGHFRVAQLFLKSVFNSSDRQFFLRDHNYWQT
jgi:glycosyltransferase involved in cell wall biosynthesis